MSDVGLLGVAQPGAASAAGFAGVLVDAVPASAATGTATTKTLVKNLVSMRQVKHIDGAGGHSIGALECNSWREKT